MAGIMTTREDLDLYFLIRAQVWNDTLETFDAATVANIVRTLQSVRADVLAQLLSNTEQLTDVSTARLVQLDAWVSEVLAGASATVTGTITEASILAATASLVEYNAMMSLDGTSPVVKTVGFTREQLVTWFRDTDIFEGMNLTTRVNNAMSAGAKDAILEAIRKAGIEGKGTAAIVQRAINAGVDAGFQLTEREAVTLARSYVQAANVGAMDAVMEANKGLLRGWRWAAKLGSRTCPRCAGLDGTFYKIDDKNIPPMPLHWRCRCLKQFLTNNSRDFGVPDDEVQRVIRPWVEREKGTIGRGGNRKILNAGTTKDFYGEWFQTLSAKKQDEIVGPTRAALLRDGTLKWGDLVDKTTGRQRTLEELVSSPGVTKPIKAEEALPYVGIKRGTPIPADKALAGANPMYTTGGMAYSKNCQRCVQTYELRRRGYDVEAKPYDFEKGAAQEIRFGYEMYQDPDVYGVYKAHLVKDKISKIQAQKMIDSMPDGARGSVLFAWDSKKGHTFSFERIDGKTLFIDPQNGKETSLPKKYNLKLGISFFRTDNLKLKEDFDFSLICQKAGGGER
jgi:SPP1 gp7 family putative phage head morphogenesis protein